MQNSFYVVIKNYVRIMRLKPISDLEECRMYRRLNFKRKLKKLFLQGYFYHTVEKMLTFMAIFGKISRNIIIQGGDVNFHKAKHVVTISDLSFLAMIVIVLFIPFLVLNL